MDAKKAKIARIHVDREGRITFPKPNEAPPDDEWGESVLTDPRARWRLDDSMLGRHASMFIQIICEKCHRDELKAIDDLITLFGKPHNMNRAVAAYVNCPRRAKRCELDFKLKQWEEAHRLRKKANLMQFGDCVFLQLSPRRPQRRLDNP